MIVTNAVVFVIGKFGIRWSALTSRIPKEILFPMVFVLCAFGSYAVNNNIFDIWVLVVMGGLGYFMTKFGLPQAPFVIAFILSRLFEDGLRRTLIMSSGDLTVLVRHPISLAFLILTAVSIVAISWGKRKKIGITAE
jgi:putative tricarboxylic transport membrane protein